MNSLLKKGTNGSVIVEASIVFPIYILTVMLIISYFNIFSTAVKFNRCVYAAARELVVNYSDYSLFEGAAENAVKKEILKKRFSKQLAAEVEYRGIGNKTKDIIVDFSDIFNYNENEGYVISSYKISGISFTKKVFLKAIGRGIERDIFHDDVWDLEPMLRGRIIIDRMGGNMPLFFELISRFRDGEASVIKSLNPDLNSYSLPDQIYKRISPYIERLSAYDGLINGSRIESRKLILVIPGDAKSEILSDEIMKLKAESGMLGILFECIRYGFLYK